MFELKGAQFLLGKSCPKSGHSGLTYKVTFSKIAQKVVK